MKLNRQQKSALKKSIKHWYNDIIYWLENGYKIRKGEYDFYWCTGEYVKLTIDDCALCMLYHDITKVCEGCPLNSDHTRCTVPGSPYIAFLRKPNLANAYKMAKMMEDILRVSE